ncbi:Aromatic-L-amino-acid decarboxylase, putative [Pediculus humanus corporis]|uniref:Aromatic-L-amino-acid decarboxylase, putative n=1 Tax=Pediculus humanus subsp. corporis TaxID=121224 RepID=E0VYL7_PEDHC|nr:Aromatic-L-amino-acid decarboxylase, putative [Pediculus humanus corporis]EEB18473.1 Aromatic-L-amino-acid decarboxylase, putative [Pediculus humanus corporis]
MDIEEYKLRGKQMIDFICNYYQTINERRVFPSIKPGYLAPLLPKEAPKKPDKWEDIMHDVDTKIMPGITHWNHPRFFAYFPAGNSFASFLGDMLSDGIGCIGFSWASSPACTELETIVLDWLGKALNLPDHLLYFTPGSIGGGVIQGSASECVLVCMLAARSDAINYLKEKGKSDKEDSEFLPLLVAYTSIEAHSCVEKAAKICMVKLRILMVDNESSMRGPKLAEAIQEDVKLGLHPFIVIATLGTTANCGFDNVKEIGPIVAKLPHCWFHVDAAYAGSSFICPELRYLKEGLELADSFNTNCNKFLNVCFDCSCLWVKDRYKLISALTVDPLYLQHDQASVTIDYRNWMIPLSRRFRSLKLWFTLRNYGIEKLQNYIRNHVKLAQVFEKLVNEDNRFEVCNVVRLGLVCFRLKAKDEVNQELLASINREGTLHMLPSITKNNYCLRFCIVYEHSKVTDIEYAWNVIKFHATQVLKQHDTKIVAPAVIEQNQILSYIQFISPDLFAKMHEKPNLRAEDSPVYVPSLIFSDLSAFSASSVEDHH